MPFLFITSVRSFLCKIRGWSTAFPCRTALRKSGGEIEARTLFLLLILTTVTCLGGFIVASASFTLSLAISATLIIVIISYLSPEMALFFLIASMLLSPEFIVGDLLGRGAGDRGVTLRFDDFLLLIIGFSWFARTAVQKELGLFRRTPLNRPIAYYIVICVISTLIGFVMGRVDLKTGALFVLKYFEYFIVYFMTVNFLTSKEQIRRFVIAILLVCTIVCVIAIVQIPAGGRVTAPFEGAMGEPNTLGGYLVLILSITLGLLLTSDALKWKTWLGTLVVLITISLLATLSRSSWVVVGPMLLTLIYFSRRKLILVVPLIIVIALAPFVTPKVIKDRALFTFTQEKQRYQLEFGDIRIDTSTSARIVSWKKVLTQDFIRHPIFGHGVTGYRFLDAQYPRVLVETGLLGFIIFLWLLASTYRNAVYTYRTTTDPLFSGLSLGYLAGFIAMLVHGIGANTFIIVRIMEPFWFLTAIIIMIPSIEADERETPGLMRNGSGTGVTV